MTRIRTPSFIFIALAFFGLEMLLITWVDRPLSEYLRTVDRDHHPLINFFRAYTNLGLSKWYLWPSGLCLIICALGLRLPNIRADWRFYMLRLGPPLLFFFACVAISGIITDVIKPILGRARPVLLEQQAIYGFHPFSFHATWNSMPSGHATTAFALAFCLIAFYPRQRIGFLLLAFILAISRIMINAHYISDVCAGGMIGFLSVYMLQKLFLRPKILFFIECLFPTNTSHPHLL